MSCVKAIECDQCGVTGDSGKSVAEMRAALKLLGWSYRRTTSRDWCAQCRRDRLRERKRQREASKR